MELCNAKRRRRLETTKETTTTTLHVQNTSCYISLPLLFHDYNVKLSSYTCITIKCND